MDDLRAALLARLAELRATCEATSNGPWHVRPNSSAVRDCDSAVLALAGDDHRFANARHIAAHSPSVMRPVWEALAAIAGLHAPEQECVVYCDRNPDCDGSENEPCAASNDGEHAYPACIECRASGDDWYEGEEFFYRYPCPTIARLAAALGVSPDGPGGGEACKRRNPHTPHGDCLGLAPEFPSEAVEIVAVHGKCPDGGTCHHGCGNRCVRVSTSAPLSGVFDPDEWPPDVVAQHAARPPSAEAPASRAEGEPDESEKPWKAHGWPCTLFYVGAWRPDGTPRLPCTCATEQSASPAPSPSSPEVTG